jgi:hypothetical protein
MSKAAELVLTWLGYFVGAMFLLFLIAASCYDLLRVFDKRKEEKVKSKKKRANVTIGQQLEIEYSVDGASLPDIEVERIFAYSGAVRVEITAMLRTDYGRDLLKTIEDRCYRAEGIAKPIPF